MKKKLMLMFVTFIGLTFGLQATSAQFIILVPKIPKIKIDKPETEEFNQQKSGQSDVAPTGEIETNRAMIFRVAR